MKILHVSTSDINGGAARAAYRLHKGLQCLGHESSMFVAKKSSTDPTVTLFTPATDLFGRLRTQLRRVQVALSLESYRKSRPVGYELLSLDRGYHGVDLLNQLPKCDVIHLHWISWFIDYHTFFPVMSKHMPVVWTLHDMNPFTGGCHYDNGCDRYRSACGTCPQLGSNRANDLSYRVWQRKQKIFQHIASERLHIVTPSRWLAGEARCSSLFGRFSVSVIPYGLDINEFVPRKKYIARTALDIPEDSKVVLFVADSIRDRRKGFSFLVDALANLNRQLNLFLISLGGGKTMIDVQTPHLHLGYIGNDRLLSLVYSAADVFVIPSLQDNLPNTVLESLACGTPVIGFDAGGVSDMVRPGITGLLAPVGDVNALRESILQILEDSPMREAMSKNCRGIAVEEYSLEVQATCYVELYEKLLASNSIASK